jgi:hypothetical protein
MAVVVEYLMIVKKADSFCDTADAFTALLNVDSSIDIEGGTARSVNDFSCEYAVTSGDIAAKAQRYFHVRFAANECDTEEKLEKFSAFLKVVRSIMNKVGGQPETLWDDISFHYARSAYKLIYRVENLMRKLIANFMLVTVGAEWVDESTPNEVKEAIGKSKRKEYLNVLHQIDFIHLANFLLRPYSTATNEDVHKLLQDAQTVDHLNHIKTLVPQSNWSRYFSSLVDCDDGFLKKRWDELYELRCRVAHNAIVNKTDCDRVATLVGELEGKLEDAIKKIPQVQVPVSEVEQLAENAAGRTNEQVGEFILLWRELERQAIADPDNETKRPWEFRKWIKLLREKVTLADDELAQAMWLNQIRNHLVHPSGLSPEVEDIAKANEFLRKLIDRLREWGYDPPKNSDDSGTSSE